MPNEMISAKDLHFKYQTNEVLSDVTFDIKPGDFVGIVGPNGSGKTTLVRLVLGLLRPTRGTVALGRARLGYLPQKPLPANLRFPSTAAEVVGLGLLSLKQFPKGLAKGDGPAIDKALDLLGIRDIKHKLIGDLSGGQQQRVFLARALVNEPEVLILDEPTLALDPEARENFFATLKELNSGKGTTILLVTHDIGNIGRYARQLLYIDKRVVFYGGFDDFCDSNEAGEYFGEFAHHIICHRHDKGTNLSKGTGQHE